MDFLLTLLLVACAIVLARLKSKVALLERTVGDLRDAMFAQAAARAATPVESATPSDAAASRASPGTPGPGTIAEPSAGPPSSRAWAESAPRAEPASPPPLPPLSPFPSGPPRPPRRPAAPARPSTIDHLVATARGWLTEGNVPVKVGMLVLFAGVAALLKYASDQGMLRLPIELRMAGVALAAVGALIFGWRQRESRRAFGLALQGGAIGVLLLVLFAAFKMYALIPPGAAFAGSVLLVAGLGVLSVRQDALALAVLGVLAGFLAPIWLSTGQGNHVALFGYYAVLNAGIVAIAWRRPWRLLNLMGFAFTFGIGALWGVLSYRPEHFVTAQAFLALFFAMYLLIPLLYAAARGPEQARVFDGSLIFGTPLVAFSLQAGLLQDDRLALAFCALGLAAIYAALAAALRRRDVFAPLVAPLVAPYAVLAVGFATLAVPLALSAQATAAVFALEGAGLVWLGLRQGRRLPLATGLLLQFAAAAAFVSGLDAATIGPPVFNGRSMVALLIAAAGFAIAYVARRHGATTIALPAYLWALLWWLGNGVAQIDRGVLEGSRVDALMLFLLGSGAVAAEVGRRIGSRALRLTSIAALAAPIALVWLQVLAHRQPFAGLGGIAWAGYVAAAAHGLRAMRAADAPDRSWAHVAVWSALATATSISLFLLARDGLAGDGWSVAAGALPWLALAVAARHQPALVGWPYAEAFEGWRDTLELLVALVLAGFFVSALSMRGDPAPLPYVPVANPLELMQATVLAVLALRLRAAGGRRPWMMPTLAGAAFVLATSVVLRADHHLGGVPWSATMFSTGLVQTSLTVLWSVIGMAAWVSGSRRMQRGVWQAGAVLMTLVLAKLVLVDRQYLGNLLGIGSFLAFGLLCTAVGYLAPVPPRRAGAPA